MKLNLEIDHDLRWIYEDDDFSPDAWFYLESSYDGFIQIWFLKDTGNSTYCVPLILSEENVPECGSISWRENYRSNYEFKSLADANARIPGVCQPLFDGTPIPGRQTEDIGKFRYYQYDELFETWSLMTPGSPKSAGHHFYTHEFHDSNKDTFVEFDKWDILADIKATFNLTQNELEWICNLDMYEHDPQCFRVIFRSEHLRGDYARKNKKILNKFLNKHPGSN